GLCRRSKDAQIYQGQGIGNERHRICFAQDRVLAPRLHRHVQNHVSRRTWGLGRRYGYHSSSYKYWRSFCWLPRMRMRREIKSPGCTANDLSSIPIRTKRPSGRSPATQSDIASTELLVPSITSTPPALARPFPSRTISSAPSSRISLSLSVECD